MLNSKHITIGFGVTFVLVGLLGFLPNPLISEGGIFEVNGMHNVVHILTGTAFLVGGLVLKGKAVATLKSVTAVYFGVAVLGFLTDGDMLLGLVLINEADRWLHLGLSMTMLAATAMVSGEKPRWVPVH
ncbi:MAG: DUF4383 domain-containing protein [Nitrospirales bacterium]|nr:DUF4383 domain-containing protein [Nitrospira sp.]MDR4501999.1 DUF4383 domain-containing protein [Nitrospirales bacterium]